MISGAFNRDWFGCQQAGESVRKTQAGHFRDLPTLDKIDDRVRNAFWANPVTRTPEDGSGSPAWKCRTDAVRDDLG